MGSGPILGLAPAPECTFLVFASPVGNYFKVAAFSHETYYFVFGLSTGYLISICCVI